MNINIKHKTIIINVCKNIIILISIKIKDYIISASVFNKKKVIILIHIIMLIKIVNISIQLNLSCDRDFIFKLKALNKLSVYIHIVNVNITSIFIQNDFNQFIMLSKQTYINKIIEYDIIMYCLINVNKISIIVKFFKN